MKRNFLVSGLLTESRIAGPNWLTIKCWSDNQGLRGAPFHAIGSWSCVEIFLADPVHVSPPEDQLAHPQAGHYYAPRIHNNGVSKRELSWFLYRHKIQAAVQLQEVELTDHELWQFARPGDVFVLRTSALIEAWMCSVINAEAEWRTLWTPISA